MVDFNGETVYNDKVRDNNYGANLREYTFKDSTALVAQKADKQWSFTNCTYNGIAMTAENITTDVFPGCSNYRGIDSDIWVTNTCTVNGTAVTG